MIQRTLAALALVASCVDARPNRWGCNSMPGNWNVGYDFSGRMSVSGNTIQDGSNECTVTGVPSEYDGGKSYTIAVGCPNGFDGNRGCAHIFSVKNGNTCKMTSGRSKSTKSYTWTAPDADGGDIPFDALCGHYNYLARSATVVSKFSGLAKPTTTATTVTTTKTTATTVTTTKTATTTTTVTTATTTTVTTITATTTTTTTTTIFGASNVDCVESHDPCTAACEKAADRNYKVTVEQVDAGKACVGAPADCIPEEDDCPATTTTTTTTTATATATTTTTTITTATVTTTTTLERLNTIFLGQPIDLTDFACRTDAEQNKEGNDCHPGGPIIWENNLVLDEEITEIWNEFEMGVHFNDAVLGFEMRIGVQSRLEALNPVLTVDYIADNFHREPSAYGKDWTPEMLESATNIGAADACYFGIFPGSKCESNGRVYRINAPWYTGHPGGGYATTTNRCGSIIENWLTISGSHEAFYESSVKKNTHIAVVGYDRDANGGEEFAAYFQGKLTGVDCPVVEATDAPGTKADTCTGDDITYTGYVSDVQCTEQRTASESFRAPDNNIDPLAEPEKHTVNCLYNIKSCRESGYDILDEDATDGLHYAKYRLDGDMNAQVEALLKPLAATATDLAGYRVTITAKATATTDLNGRDGFTVCGGTVVAEGEDAGGTTEEVVIVTTASTAAVEAGATTIDLADVSQITVGDSLTIGKGDDAETAVVAAITLTRARSRREGHAVAVAGTVELTAPLKNAHAEGAKITFEAATKEEEVTDAPVTEAPEEQLSEAEEEAAAAADAAAAAAAGDSGHTVTAIVLVIVLTLVLGVLLSVYLIRNETPDVAGLGSTGTKPPCNEPETAYGNKENPAFGLDDRAASISA